ncbi:MAG: glycosyltransferase family 2 protein [Candidatus Omnitrophica bacterium]|nr:glycosyltransferase family 2 protein [Candidatus Omnitrophota bacterium]
MIHIFLPAYNEEIALPRLVEKFGGELKSSEEPYRIVVLDDGSSDRTLAAAAELSKKYPLDILRHPRNLGLGITLRDGIEHLSRVAGDEDLIVTLDCDDTHEPKYLPAALKKIREGYDVVILSRYCPGGGEAGLSPVKAFLSRGAGIFLSFFFPIRGVREFSCGYRVYRAAILKKALKTFGADLIRLPHLGFVATPELLIKMRMIRAHIVESPFTLRYDQKPTPSKNKSFKTIQGYFALVWNFWGRKA